MFVISFQRRFDSNFIYTDPIHNTLHMHSYYLFNSWFILLHFIWVSILWPWSWSAHKPGRTPGWTDMRTDWLGWGCWETSGKLWRKTIHPTYPWITGVNEGLFPVVTIQHWPLVTTQWTAGAQHLPNSDQKFVQNKCQTFYCHCDDQRQGKS